VADAKELRARLDAYAAQVKAGQQPAQPAVILVYAPAALHYGQLTRFLELALPTHPTVHVFVDQPLPPVAGKKL
jgi:hypothetical protein